MPGSFIAGAMFYESNHCQLSNAAVQQLDSREGRAWAEGSGWTYGKGRAAEITTIHMLQSAPMAEMRKLPCSAKQARQLQIRAVRFSLPNVQISVGGTVKFCVEFH